MDPRVCAATVAMAPIARAMAGRVIEASHRPGLVAERGVTQSGENAQPDREDQRKDQAEEEVRHREGDHGDDLDHPVDPSAANGGQHTEADPEDRGQDQRTEDQGHGDRQRLADELADRLIVGPRSAQIALHHSAEPVPVLAEQGLVQPEFGPLGGDLFQGCLVTKDLSGWVGAGQAGQEEGQCADDEHQHESGGKPAQDEEKHRWLPVDRSVPARPPRRSCEGRAGRGCCQLPAGAKLASGGTLTPGTGVTATFVVVR